MENVKSNSGRKKLSDDLRRTHEYRVYLNDSELVELNFLRKKFGDKQIAQAMRTFIKNVSMDYRFRM